MATYEFFKSCLKATKEKFNTYKRIPHTFYRDVKEIRNQLYIVVQYDEITQIQYRKLDNEFKKYCKE